jgi:FkbM family methyltransferase
MLYRSLVSFLTKLQKLVGIGICRYSELVLLRQKSSNLHNSWTTRSNLDLGLIRVLDPTSYGLITNLLNKSKSQLKQDLFVLAETKYKKGGYFIELGATNGINFSNTFLLEQEFSWKGILCEPARAWTNDLLMNRPGANIETLCVWKDSHSSLMFRETNNLELSTINSFSSSDMHAHTRKMGILYNVKTISLNDLLTKFNAPFNIDYLSIDTEGSEYEILKAFNFSNYDIKVITVEHNHTPRRDLIFKLLSGQGYERKFTSISDYDDWYVKI